jgi:hypothetical protein
MEMNAQSRFARAVRLGVGLAAFLIVPAMVGASAPAAGAASTNKVTVTAGEYTYKVAGSPKPGNVEVEFKNAGVEYHMLVMAQLKKGVTVKQLTTALMSNDQSAGDKVLVNQVAPLPGFLGPDQSTTTIVNLKPGHYGMFCFFAAPDGKPHLAHGMVKLFDVKGAKSSFQPPTDGVAAVSLTDGGITLPSTGFPAHSWVKVTNDTSVQRSLVLGEYLTSTATFEAADAYFNEFFSTGQAPAGDPPASLDGGASNIPAGSSAYFEVDMKNGSYVLVSSNDELEHDPASLHVDFTVG